MFESNEDIDVDDEFLNEIFDSGSIDVNYVINAKTNTVQNGLTLKNEPQPEDGRNNERIPIFIKTDRTNAVKQDSNLGSRNSSLLTDVNAGAIQGNKENKRKYDSSPVPCRIKRERKFPGPAGLLPDRKFSHAIPLKLDPLEDKKSPPNSSPDELCSQGQCSGSVLEDEPWQTLLADLGPERNILDVVNVANVKRKAAAKCFVGKKVPFLAAVLHHLDVSSPDPCIILRDSTGEIHGTLHREVWEQFAGALIVGSVLVVRNVGLLSTGHSSRRHYLNITANNMVTIYSPSSEKQARLHCFSRPDFKQIIMDWKALVSPSNGVGSPASVSSPTLFNSSFSSPTSSNCVPNRKNSNVGVNTPKGPVQNHSSRVIPRTNIVQSLHCSTPKPAQPTPSNHLRAAGKSLLSSFTNNPGHDFFTTKISNSHTIGNCNNNNKILINTNSNQSFHMKSIGSPVLSSKWPQPSSRPGLTNEKSFNFKPVIINPSTTNNHILSNCLPESKLNQNKQSFILNNTNHPSPGSNKTTLILSQTEELSAEEQSMVESVFDGLDADSLFDDDF